MALILAEEDGAVCGTVDCREGARFSALCRPAELKALLVQSCASPSRDGFAEQGV